MANRNAEQRMAIVPRVFIAMIAVAIACLVGLIYALVVA